MATAYLMSGGTTYVTFTPTGGVGYGGDVYLSCGASSVVSGTYKCTYNCPSGSTVYCTAYRWWGGGTVCDGWFEVGN